MLVLDGTIPNNDNTDDFAVWFPLLIHRPSIENLTTHGEKMLLLLILEQQYPSIVYLFSSSGSVCLPACRYVLGVLDAAAS